MLRFLLAVVLLGHSSLAAAQSSDDPSAMQRSVDELRSAIGSWQVVTEFLNEDGSAARTVKGSYQFSWIVPDRVVTGRSEISELKQASGILFYINEAKRIIEMVSVGPDGYLWIMTGPLGGDHRLSREFKTTTGATQMLRFTRFNVFPDSFESRMEITADGGKTWTPGNHQRFRRAGS